MRIAGVHASTGQVHLEFTGLDTGIAASRRLRQGESFTYGGRTITFSDFDLSDFAPENGKTDVGVRFAVNRAGEDAATVVPVFRLDAGGERIDPDAPVPGLDGVRLRVGGIDPQQRVVEVAVIDPSAPPDPGEPATFAADVSIKPMIGLLWVGLTVLLAGGLMAMLRRGEDFTAVNGAPRPATN